jgi:hypothetical protein
MLRIFWLSDLACRQAGFSDFIDFISHYESKITAKQRFFALGFFGFYRFLLTDFTDLHRIILRLGALAVFLLSDFTDLNRFILRLGVLAVFLLSDLTDLNRFILRLCVLAVFFAFCLFDHFTVP